MKKERKKEKKVAFITTLSSHITVGRDKTISLSIKYYRQTELPNYSLSLPIPLLSLLPLILLIRLTHAVSNRYTSVWCTYGVLEGSYGVLEGSKTAKWSTDRWTDRSTPIFKWGSTCKYTGAPAYLGVHPYFDIRVDP